MHIHIYERLVPPPCCGNYLANFTADAVQPLVFKMKLLNVHSDDK